MPENKKNPTYRDLMNTLKEMQESADMFKSLVYNDLESDGFNIKLIESFVNSVKKEYIEIASEEDLEKIIYELGIKDEEKIKLLCKEKYTVLKIKENPDVEDIDIKVDDEFTEEVYVKNRHQLLTEVILGIIDNIKEVKTTFDEVEDIKKQADEQMEEYIKYVTSEEYETKQKDRIDQLKRKAEDSKNPEEKKRCLNLIKALEDSKSFTFLHYRIDKLGDIELKKIEDSFFSNSGSSYLMKRFRDKIVKLGYDEKIYLSFFNIEEKYLEEKYHVFNNLFLFHIIRYIAHIDTSSKDDRLFAATIITNLGNLVYNRFTSNTIRNKFLDVVRNFLDRFTSRYDIFEEKNVLHPNHPTRIEKSNKRTEEVKQMIYANLENEGYIITDEVRKLDLDDLRTLYDEYLNELEHKKELEKNSTLDDLINKLKLNSEVHYREKLKKKYLQFSEIDEETNKKFNMASIEEIEKLIEDFQSDCKSFENSEDTDY